MLITDREDHPHVGVGIRSNRPQHPGQADGSEVQERIVAEPVC